MLNQLTPIVRHLLIINVVVFIGLQLICQATKVGDSCSIYRNYFTLHKSNALQFRETLPLDEFREAYVKMEGDRAVMTAEANKFQPLQIITYFFSHDLYWNLSYLFQYVCIGDVWIHGRTDSSGVDGFPKILFVLWVNRRSIDCIYGSE